ncbi:tyrosine--tRNA ligase [archaeon]|nr:tyrosine--tRNA ligase [archaeon]MBL7056999.1 tyrosine--tRNA ligase [Candidatus Woesearchaeota archaeon]
MDIDKRLELIGQVGEEIITPSDLRALLEEKKRFIAYDGFEPSGTMHIAQGILRAINVNKMTKAGAKFKMLVADWHGWANNKMGGDLDRIQTVGKYFIEVWKASGMKLDDVEFIWVSDMVKDQEYWKKVMQVARNSTMKRIIRCGQIMGRKEGEVMQASQILYPCMQAADIFHLKADVCQLGMDQRKVNVLAREVGPKLGYWKPIVVSHHMLMGLGQPTSSEKDAVDRAIDLKMSKSKPDSAIFMTDTKEEIKRKINKAYCPQGESFENPILEYCKYIIFEKYKTLTIERPEKFGGNLEFKSYAELEKEFIAGKLHPMDLKNTVAAKIDELIEPVRIHFEKNSKARKLKEQVESFKVTR